MPKKQLTYLILILLTISLIYFLYPDQKTTNTSEKKFAISDTASIKKIFIADKSGFTITLKKTKNNWTVNNKYDVPKIRTNTILNAIHKLKFQRHVPKEAFKNVVKNLATTGVKVEIYDHNISPIKTYIIGNPTTDHKGNYILLEGSTQPSIVHIPHLNGYPSASYGIVGQRIEPLNKWRKTTIFKLKSTEIKTPPTPIVENKNVQHFFVSIQYITFKFKFPKYEISTVSVVWKK